MILLAPIGGWDYKLFDLIFIQTIFVWIWYLFYLVVWVLCTWIETILSECFRLTFLMVRHRPRKKDILYKVTKCWKNFSHQRVQLTRNKICVLQYSFGVEHFHIFSSFLLPNLKYFLVSRMWLLCIDKCRFGNQSKLLMTTFF